MSKQPLIEHRNTGKKSAPTPSKNTPKLTLAYSFNKDTEGKLEITYGIAQCYATDTFIKAVGRELAIGQFESASADSSSAYNGVFVVEDRAGLVVAEEIEKRFIEARAKAVLEASKTRKGRIAELNATANASWIASTLLVREQAEKLAPIVSEFEKLTGEEWYPSDESIHAVTDALRAAHAAK